MKDKVVTTRFAAAEHKAISVAAEKEGRTISGLMRRIALEYLAKKKG